MNWIFIASLKQFRIHDFIRDFGFVEYLQKNKIQEGDIVYLYITAPYKRVEYKMVVERANVVVWWDGGFTMKFLDLTHKDEGYIELRPANPDFPVSKGQVNDVWPAAIMACERKKFSLDLELMRLFHIFAKLIIKAYKIQFSQGLRSKY